MTDVVITGVGLISPAGDRPAALHAALCGGAPAFGPSSVWADAGDARVAEVRDFTARNYLGARNLRPLDRTGQLAAVAAELALQDSGWTVAAREAHDVGLVLGTTFCSVRTIGEFDRRAMRDGPEYASPLDFANTVINAAAGQVAIWHKLRGVNSTISAGAASGVHAIGYAAQLIRAGRATTVIAGGAEELCFESYTGFAGVGLLSDDTAARPFDRRRRGCLLGEAAAFLVLEAEEAARARGARVLGRIEGFGAAYDSREAMSRANGANALTIAIQRALGPAGASDLAGVVSSASGSPTLDAREGRAIHEALGARAAAVPVTSLKGHVGETQGASGALQTIAALQAIESGCLPPIGGLEEPDPEVMLDLVSGGPRRITGRRGLVTAMAREGNCCALVISAGRPA